MAKSYNRIWVHAIWATKNRTNLIESNMEDQLYAYMAKKFKETDAPYGLLMDIKIMSIVYSFLILT